MKRKYLMYIPHDKSYIEILGHRIDGFDSFESFYEYLKKFDSMERELQKYKKLEERLNGISVEHVINAFIERVETGTNEGYERGRILTNKDVDMWEQYKKLGTVEELREAKEKQIAKKPKKSGFTDNKGAFHEINGINGVPYDLCPNCDTILCTDGYFGRDKNKLKYCEKCGQRLDWSE